MTSSRRCSRVWTGSATGGAGVTGGEGREGRESGAATAGRAGRAGIAGRGVLSLPRPPCHPCPHRLQVLDGGPRDVPARAGVVLHAGHPVAIPLVGGGR